MMTNDELQEQVRTAELQLVALRNAVEDFLTAPEGHDGVAKRVALEAALAKPATLAAGMKLMQALMRLHNYVEQFVEVYGPETTMFARYPENAEEQYRAIVGCMKRLTELQRDL